MACTRLRAGKFLALVMGMKASVRRRRVSILFQACPSFALFFCPFVNTFGEKVKALKYFRKYEIRLAKAQGILSRRTKDGANWHQARIKVARIHEKITNARHDFLHKLSTKLIRENQVISTEDLQVKIWSRITMY
ncbi:transposase [Seinonella peptonophila]|uniref:transposase n=1 Tax=Seinonella peptonophila TaxID=112248 RepID=UPI001FEC8A8A|nr:transposase [Seinonella peptonophila]